MSRKTSFSQFEGTSDERPVITISLYQNTELNITYKSDLNIYYCSSYKTWQEKCKKLNIGSNYFTHNDGLNKTEEVFLEKTRILKIMYIVRLTYDANILKNIIVEMQTRMNPKLF